MRVAIVQISVRTAVGEKIVGSFYRFVELRAVIYVELDCFNRRVETGRVHDDRRRLHIIVCIAERTD